MRTRVAHWIVERERMIMSEMWSWVGSENRRRDDRITLQNTEAQGHLLLCSS